MKSFSKAIALIALLSVNVVTATEINEKDTQHNPLIGSSDNSDPMGDRMLSAHRGGNGGNSIASQFTTIAKNSAVAWEAACDDQLLPICNYLPDFKEMLDKESRSFVKVLSAPEVMAYDYEEREAVNFFNSNDEANIIVSESKWESINKDLFSSAGRKINLVLHEYFSLMGIESSDYYEYSRSLYTLLLHGSYDLERIAGETAIPEACSVYVKPDDTLTQSLRRNIQSSLSELDYENKEDKSDARYIMKTTLSCNSTMLINHTCSVYVEVVDTLKQREIYYERHITDQALGGKRGLINSLYEKALGDISYCGQ